MPYDGPFAVGVECDDGPYDAASFFRHKTYGVRISVGILADVMITQESFDDMGAGPNMVSEDILPPAWRMCNK